ncbi:hypothetical protein [Glycomyces rhizosphaerae]|uniref:Uncharacterized protein n=1 Tax=Glycomyces rhizosphaerae TaxID=2054422 RepID=A0ABV7Q0W8_9ACTN
MAGVLVMPAVTFMSPMAAVSSVPLMRTAGLEIHGFPGSRRAVPDMVRVLAVCGMTAVMGMIVVVFVVPRVVALGVVTVHLRLLPYR